MLEDLLLIDIGPAFNKVLISILEGSPGMLEDLLLIKY